MSDTTGSRPKRDRAARATADDGAAVALRFRTANENVREAAPLARKMRWRRAKLVVAGSALIVGGWYFGVAPVEFARFETATGAWTDTPGSVVAAIATFIVASATPFVPGAEIGFALIAVFGAPIAVLVYVSMVAALTLSFLVGRLVPAGHVAALFGYLGLDRASGLVLRMAPLGPQARLDLLAGNLPDRLVPILLRHRYLALVVLLNLPGNSAVGGGGGVAFTAGLSGLYPLPAYLAAVLVAVAPVPTIVLTLGYLG